MIPKTDFFELIEDYCLEQLRDEQKLEFEAELKKNTDLRNEVELWMEIQGAIEEKEVLTLRNKLEKISLHSNPVISNTETFELLNDFGDIQEISEVLSSEELINFYDSLPKVHVYHHESTSNENIHQFYREQNESDVLGLESSDFTDFDFEEFEGLEEAILEKDILQFRQKLKQVAKSVEPQFTVEEIDEYLNGELSGSELIDFERDMVQSRSLRHEIALHKEIDIAISEGDVINLRNQISNILQTETSWNVSEKSIEDYIDGALEGNLLEEFMMELNDNTDLIAEVELRKQVNESIKEKDIFDLRNKLNAARESADVKKINMIIPETRKEHMRFWRSSVAVLIVLIGIAGVLRNSFMSSDNIYSNYYEAPAWSPERSLDNEINILQKANISYLNADYAGVVKILGQATNLKDRNPVYDFYQAASLQNLNEYNKAVEGFTRVINHGDNLYVEEAQWYRSLCYVKMENYTTAKNELMAVIDRKGHFENEAKAVLRRLKYSFK